MSLKTKVLTAAAFAALLASTAVQAVTYTVGTGVPLNTKRRTKKSSALTSI